MVSFSIGVWSVVGMFGMPLLFFAGAFARSAGAYLDGKEAPPKRPLKPWIAIAVVSGFLIGSFYQGTSEAASACMESGKNLGTCLLVPGAAEN